MTSWWAGGHFTEAAAVGQRARSQEYQAAGEAAGPGQEKVQEAAQILPGGRTGLCHHRLPLRHWKWDIGNTKYLRTMNL